MKPSELLKQIKNNWVKCVVQDFSDAAYIEENTTARFFSYFNALEQSLDTGNPEWLEPVIQDWSNFVTLSDLQNNQNTLSDLVKKIILSTNQVIHQQLPLQDASNLTESLLPISLHAMGIAANLEADIKVVAMTKQLDEVRTSLEKLDRSKSSFIAVAAHELKTPLTLVEGYTSMLSDSNCIRETQSENQAYIQGIQKGTKRLRSIIDDMIDVSLIDNNLMSMNFQPFWLDRLLEIIIIEMKPSFKERNIHFKIQEFDGYKSLNYGDPERLLQVIRNLIINAIKYTPDGGKVQVTGRKLPGFIEICVRDTGIGIDPNDQTLIFEKFTRIGNVSLHSSGKTKFKGGGPGLGLHIAKGILEAHGGTIWVESPGYDEEKYPGSTFHLLLPLRETPPDDKTAKLFENLHKKE